MLLCPNCTETLKKNPKHREGVWYCSDCGMVWFILDIPVPKYLRNKGEQKEREIQKAAKGPDSFTKEDAQRSVKKAIENRHP